MYILYYNTQKATMMKRQLVQQRPQNPKKSKTESNEDNQSQGLKYLQKRNYRPQSSGKVDNSPQKTPQSHQNQQIHCSFDWTLNNSQKSSFQTEDGSLLDFTFCKQQRQANKITSQPRFCFQSPKLESVLLYALLFNHLHLSQLHYRVDSVFNKSLEVYNRVKNHLLTYDQYAQTMDKQRYIFPQMTFRLLQCRQLDLVSRRQSLKRMISSMDSSIMLTIFTNLVKDLQSQSSQKISSKRVARDAQIKQEGLRVIRFSEELGININIFSQEKKVCFGKKQGWITVEITKKVEEKVFSLKKIACYQQ